MGLDILNIDEYGIKYYLYGTKERNYASRMVVHPYFIAFYILQNKAMKLSTKIAFSKSFMNGFRKIRLERSDYLSS